MYKDPNQPNDALIQVLMTEIERLKHESYRTNQYKRIEKIQESAAHAWAKIDHLKAQMYKMSKGYEKKIAKLEAELERTPIQ
jgi:uncharacterized small protein (DUF1192 family)